MLNLTPWAVKKVPAQREDEPPIYSLQREVNRLFDDFLCSLPFESYTGFSTSFSEQTRCELTPRIDRSEDEKTLLIKVELPGIGEKDVQISLNQDLLTISGEKKHDKEHSDKGWCRSECQYGFFSRSVPLPCEVIIDKTEASYKDGVLLITLPKSPSEQKTTKSIAVKCAS